MFSRLVSCLTLIVVATLSAVSQSLGNFSDYLDVRSTGAAAGRVHFDSWSLGKYAVTGQGIAKSIGSILTFQAAAWGFSGPVFWEVYLYDKRPPEMGTDIFAYTRYSATGKIPGRTGPPQLACVTVVSLDQVGSIIGTSDISANYDPFGTRLDFALAHEATHCYQNFTSKSHREPEDESVAKWFIEGSACWLAGDYLESTGRGYPGYWEPKFRERHQESMLRHSNGNHFFFKWLEGEQALKQRAAVIDFVKDMMEMPWTPTTQFEISLKQWWLAKHSIPLANVLSMFGSAIVRGTVPGIRAGNLFLAQAKVTVLPGFNMARVSAMAAAAAATGTEGPPMDFAQIDPFSKPMPSGKKGPEEYGFEVFDLGISQPLVPPPRAYDVSMVGVDDDVFGRLSTRKGDNILDESKGWIRAESTNDRQMKFLEGNWVSVARTDPSKGQKTRVLIRLVP